MIIRRAAISQVVFTLKRKYDFLVPGTVDRFCGDLYGNSHVDRRKIVFVVNRKADLLGGSALENITPMAPYLDAPVPSRRKSIFTIKHKYVYSSTSRSKRVEGQGSLWLDEEFIAQSRNA